MVRLHLPLPIKILLAGLFCMPTISLSAMKKIKKVLFQGSWDKELLKAAHNNMLADVQNALDKGASSEAFDEVSGATPLIDAASSGFVEIATVLLSRGAGVNAQNLNKQTSLMLAAYFGNLAMVKLLLKAGADSSMIDKRGKTAAQYAEELHPEVSQFIVDHAHEKRIRVSLASKFHKNDKEPLTQFPFSELFEEATQAKPFFLAVISAPHGNYHFFRAADLGRSFARRVQNPLNRENIERILIYLYTGKNEPFPFEYVETVHGNQEQIQRFMKTYQ